jgi:hypothetical protein
MFSAYFTIQVNVFFVKDIMYWYFDISDTLQFSCNFNEDCKCVAKTIRFVVRKIINTFVTIYSHVKTHYVMSRSGIQLLHLSGQPSNLTNHSINPLRFRLRIFFSTYQRVFSSLTTFCSSDA